MQHLLHNYDTSMFDLVDRTSHFTFGEGVPAVLIWPYYIGEAIRLVMQAQQG